MRAKSADLVQAAVEDLAAEIGLAVVIEDQHFRPLWWSAQGAVDEVRTATIMQRSVPPAARALTKRIKLLAATGPIRTPSVPEANMLPRWCVPIRREGRLVGFMWVIDPDESITRDRLPLLTECAEFAARVIATDQDDIDEARARRRDLLASLEVDHDSAAAREFLLSEGLAEETVAGVDEGAASRGRWELRNGLTLHVNPPAGHRCTSGPPLPLVDLRISVRRARATRSAMDAGAELSAPSWDALGVWRLLVEAPESLMPNDFHPAVAMLSDPRNSELLHTVRAFLELGGDAAETARQLHVHRTTLYYRLNRLTETSGADLKDPRVREDLLAGLRLRRLRELA